MNYIPSEKITIAPSLDIEGLGAHALFPIQENEDLGYTHMDSLIPIEFQQGFQRESWAGYVNHSDTPNIKIVKAKEIHLYREEEVFDVGGHTTELIPFTIKYYKAYALRDIRVGEEITSNYRDTSEDACGCGLSYIDEIE